MGASLARKIFGAGQVIGPRAGRCATIHGMREEDSDEALIMIFAKTGEYAAFDIVHRRNHRPLVRYLLAKVRNLQTAEDIAQEAWNNVVKALRKGSYQVREDASFRTYLYRVAENCRHDEFRRNNMRIVENVPVEDCDEVPDASTAGESDADPASDPVYALHQKRLLERFEKFLMSLSPEQRETAGLYLMGYSREEIAERAGVGTETVKSRIRYLEPKMEAWREQQRLELSEDYGQAAS